MGLEAGGWCSASEKRIGLKEEVTVLAVVLVGNDAVDRSRNR